MNYISEILQNNYSDQGIQDVLVYYDSIVFNLKVKKDTSFYNVLLIEKILFDYDNNKIDKLKNGLVINFGDTQYSSPFKCGGNGFLKSFLDDNKKRILLVGVKQNSDFTTVPVIFSYDINEHSYKKLFPLEKDDELFSTFNNYSFSSDYFPQVNFSKNEINILFQSYDNDNQFLNNIVLKINSDIVDINKYEIFKYDKNSKIDFKNLSKDLLIFGYNSYLGVSSKV